MNMIRSFLNQTFSGEIHLNPNQHELWINQNLVANDTSIENSSKSFRFLYFFLKYFKLRVLQFLVP